MQTMASRPTRLFTVEEANRMLPLVRAIVSDLVELSRDVVERRQRLNHLMEGRELSAGDFYSDELAEIEKDLDRDTLRLQEYVKELRDLGVEPKGPEGLVDFPAMINGKPALLCWKLGEPEIAFYHGLEDGFAGRQPIKRRTPSESITATTHLDDSDTRPQ